MLALNLLDSFAAVCHSFGFHPLAVFAVAVVVACVVTVSRNPRTYYN